MKRIIRYLPVVILVTFISTAALGQTESDVTAPAAPADPAAEENSAIGLNIDFGIATHYNFRGLNVFTDSTQQATKPAFFPSITQSFGETGLYAGYWGAFQINGDNRGEVVAGALGHEQDLYVGFDRSFAKNDMLTFSALVTYFFYPFAESGDVALPSYIEPLLGFSVATAVDIGISVSYFIGLDDLTSPYTHLYIKPSVGKSFTFSDRLGLDLGLGVGFKVWNDDDTADAGNTVDVAFDVGVPISVAGSFYVSPGISMVWTNLEGRADTGDVDENGDAITRDYNAGDQGFVVASVHFGADF